MLAGELQRTENGPGGVEIQDKQPLTESDKEQMFVDIMPEFQQMTASPI